MASSRSRQDPAARTRRRFARRQWARRWLTWRYLLAGVLVVGVVAFGIYAVYFSAWLRTDGVKVAGVEMLTEQAVREAAAVSTDEALASQDLEAIRARVANLDAVESASVSREWPHHVVVEVVERTPIAVVDTGAGIRYVDPTGAFFGNLDQQPDDLPLIVRGAEADTDALAEAAAVVDALDTVVADMVDQVVVASVDRIELRLDDGRLVRWGSAEQSAEKAEVLLALLGEDAQVYDVSVPGMPTTS